MTGLIAPPAVSPNNVRVADAVLTTLALGYSNTDCVGSVLFPSVPVTQRSGIIIKFGPEAFRLYNTRRTAGAVVAEVEFGYSAGNYSIVQDAISAKVPVEFADEAKGAHSIDLGQGAVSMGQEVLIQIQEYDHAALATTPGNFDANHKIIYGGADSWFNPDSDPLGDISEGRNAVRRSCGRYPNVLVLSPDAWTALQKHPKVRAQFPVLNGIVTLEMFAPLVQIKTVQIGTRTYWNDGDEDFSDIWGTHAVMAWVNPMSQNPGTQPGIFQRAMPSFGYNYVLTAGTVVEQPWYNNATRSWMYPNLREQQAQLTGMNAGFLFHGAGVK